MKKSDIYPLPHATGICSLNGLEAASPTNTNQILQRQFSRQLVASGGQKQEQKMVFLLYKSSLFPYPQAMRTKGA